MTNNSPESGTRWIGRIASNALWFFIPLVAFSEARAGGLVRSATGANAAAIQATVDQFRADLGSLNPNVTGSFLSGRREINWDGVPDSSAAPNNLPADFFNVTSPRGVVFTTPGTGFRVSADSSNSSGTPVEFGEIDPTYPTSFAPFSAERLFTPIGSNTLDVTFFVPGTTIPASVSGFGVVFSDVDLANTTSIVFFDVAGNTLGTFFAPNSNGSETFSFLGVSFNSGERVARVRITCGNQVLATGNTLSDLVVMDDFIYGEPVPFPDVIAVNSANNTLVRFNSATPDTIVGTYSLSGLGAGENLVGIDFRPSTGQLYGLVSDSTTARLVIVPPTGGALVQVGNSFAISGTDFGFDFNPTVDRIRLVHNNDQNISMDPVNGAITLQTPLNPGNPNVVGSAYTNSVSGATTTQLFGIDSGTDTLVLQNPPASGTLTTRGPLGFDTSGLVGFDIEGHTNTGYATLTVSGTSRLLTVDLDDGQARPIGTGIGAGLTVRAMALLPQKVSVVSPLDTELLALGVNSNLVRFNSDTPGTVTTLAVTGLGSGETIQGIDTRPSTHVVYALGVTEGPGTNDAAGRIYTINLNTGAATAVSNGPFTTSLADNVSYGFDFNPVTDRIRIVNSADQSLRVNPDNGALVQFDTPVNAAGAETVGAVAYDRNDNDAATGTTLYAIDAATDSLVTVGSFDGVPQSPNTGTLNPVGPLGGALFSSVGGFDIDSKGQAFAALRVGTSYSLYTIDLVTGTAISRGLISDGGLTIRGLTVPPTPSTLANISTRTRVETGDNALIGGFIVTGTQDKKVIVRAIGPSLPLPDKLANPTLELRNSSGTILKQNDDWMTSSPADLQAIIDSTIPPSNDLESAVVATLPANASYTAIVRGVNDTVGTGVVEVFDLDRSVDSKLANISTRGLVQTGDTVLIAGTIVLGEQSQRVIIRAIGPSLSIAGKLLDPTLELHDGNGGLIRDNDNWRIGGQETEIIASTVPPPNDFESAIVETLPGNGALYTAIVRGANGNTGIAVVEVFVLP